jgi:hypothetical protein
MRTHNKFSILVAAVIVLLAARSFAASDYLLEIEGVKGECSGKKFKMTQQSDGSWLAKGVPAGTYKICYSVDNTLWTEQKSSGKTVPPMVTFNFEVQAPRDMATGQASGKRMHKPFVITKELDKMSPKTTLGEILVGDLDGDGSVDKATGDPVHGVDVKLGVTPTTSSAASPTDPIPGVDSKTTGKGKPLTSTYDVVAIKKI